LLISDYYYDHTDGNIIQFLSIFIQVNNPFWKKRCKREMKKRILEGKNSENFDNILKSLKTLLKKSL
jgi:hypothetical protein